MCRCTVLRVFNGRLKAARVRGDEGDVDIEYGAVIIVIIGGLDKESARLGIGVVKLELLVKVLTTLTMVLTNPSTSYVLSVKAPVSYSYPDGFAINEAENC